MLGLAFLVLFPHFARLLLQASDFGLFLGPQVLELGFFLLQVLQLGPAFLVVLPDLVRGYGERVRVLAEDGALLELKEALDLFREVALLYVVLHELLIHFVLFLGVEVEFLSPLALQVLDNGGDVPHQVHAVVQPTVREHLDVDTLAVLAWRRLCHPALLLQLQRH